MGFVFVIKPLIDYIADGFEPEIKSREQGTKNKE
jgi:hypothetical protein